VTPLHDHEDGGLSEPSAAMYRALAEAVPAMVFSAAPDGALDYVNQRWIEYTGLSYEQSLGSTWGPLVHPADAAGVAAAWTAAVAAQCEHEATYRLRGMDGTYRWHVTRAVPMKDARGAVVRWFGTTTDIDEAKRTAERLAFLVQAGTVLSGTLDYELTLDNIAHLAVERAATFCFVDLLCDDGSLDRVAWAHTDPRWTERMAECRRYVPVPGVGDSLIATVIATGTSLTRTGVDEAMLRRSAQSDEHLAFMRELAFDALVVVPLTASGNVLGALTMGTAASAGRTADAADVALAEELGRRAGVAVSNARLYAAEQRAARQLQFAADAGNVLAHSLELDETLDALLGLVVPAMGDSAVINLREEDGRVRAVAIRHADPAQAATLARIRGSYYASERATTGTPKVIRTGRPEIVRRIDEEFVTSAFTGGAQDVIRALNLRTTLIVPLISRGRTIGTLGAAWASVDRTYTEADLPLFEDLAGRAAVAIEHAQLYARVHHVATALQEAALPRSLPAVAGVSFDAVYRPGKIEAQIGGDWYDAFALPDGRIVISIGDVLGSGLDAAIAMTKVRQTIRTASLGDADPAAILDVADVALRLDDPDKLATAMVGLYDPGTHTLTCVAAGHPAPLMRSADGTVAEPFLERGLPLGLRTGERAPSHTIVLEPGAFLVFYTDGLIESTRDLIEGERRLHAALADPAVCSAPRPADAIYRAVLFDGAHDDVAVLTLATSPAPE
jgi:PAS domain S-box-containing protein